MISGVRMLDPGTLERYAPGEPVLRKRFWRMPAYAPERETRWMMRRDRFAAILDESVAIHAMADATDRERSFRGALIRRASSA